MARVWAVAVIVILTLLTQIGGLVMLVVWGISRLALPRTMGAWRRASINALLFVVVYAAFSVLVVPPLAALGGRVPLPCRAQPDRAFAAGSVLLCALNRHYVVPDLIVLLSELSGEIDRAFPGTTTLFLDANFPFLNGFPLLPHLSHSDGRKLDLAFYYADADGRYLPAVTRSPIGYWAFERPSERELVALWHALMAVAAMGPQFSAGQVSRLRARAAPDAGRAAMAAVGRLTFQSRQNIH